MTAVSQASEPVALRRAFRLALLGYALVLATAAVFLWGTWHANKPHEVQGESIFWTLLVVDGLLGLIVLAQLVSAWRVRGSTSFRPANVVRLVVAAAYASLVLTFLGRLGWGFIA